MVIENGSVNYLISCYNKRQEDETRRDGMSVIVTFCLYDGIVMAADSRTTFTKSYPDGRQEVSHKDEIKKILKKAKNGMRILSVMVTWALEHSIETADSMRSRGYGLPGRSAFSIFTFNRRDLKALLCIIILSGYVIVGGICGGIYFRYFPSVKSAEASVFSVSIFAVYFILCMIPVVIELWEVRRWKFIE